MNRLRRILLELWAMLVFAVVIGFLGPFGTYLEAQFQVRVWDWWIHLMGAYVLVRPSIHLWATVADATALPKRMLVGWGVVLSSLPLALVWQWGANVFFGALGGFMGILPFATLCAVGVLAITGWARRMDLQFASAAVPDVSGQCDEPAPRNGSAGGASQDAADADAPGETSGEAAPRLLRRLGHDFAAPVIALQSEDHYVRVHGVSGSELVLMRLRDAIAEMDGADGQQVHRSWWVARNGIASVEADGRARTIVLGNGSIAPVARDSVTRLEQKGFLPVARASSLPDGHGA